jgi:alpha-D-xyloside xylohydrolase
MIEHDRNGPLMARQCLFAASLACACGSDPGGGSDGGTSATTTDAPSTAELPTEPTGDAGTDSDTAGQTTGADETGDAPEQPVIVSWEDLELILKRGDDVLLRFPADGFQLGMVATLDDDSSHDPVFVAPDQWLVVSSAEPLAGDAAVAVRLSFESGASATLTVTEQAPGRFKATLVPEPDGPTLAQLRLSPVVDPAEAFYGLGEYFDAPEHRGRVRALQLEYDPKLESQYNEAHVPVPFVIGTNGWGLFVENPYAAVVDVAAAADDRVTATFGTGPGSPEGLTFHLYAANHPLDVVRHYYATTGNPRLPAPWALGPWIWRDENMDQAEVEADIAKIRDLDLATSAIWIDRPYATAVGAFDFDAAKFSDVAGMIARIHDLGLRLALWHVPYIEDAPVNAAALAEAESSGYFPPEVGLITSPWGEPLDFTNPDAFAWWQDQVRTYTDLGIEGFKLDYGEDITCGLAGARTAWEFFDGSSERTMHSQYVRLYHRLYAETLPASGGFLLGRAGTYGDQVDVSVIWPGDLDATMTKHGESVDNGMDTYNSVGGLPAAVSAALSLGPSGFPLFASDTGGYRHSPPDKETFTRWFEHTALTPVMQVGNSASQVPWQFTPENGFDEEMLAWYRDYARLHLRLFPYLWTYINNLAVDGRPLVRPLGLAYPDLGVHPSGHLPARRQLARRPGDRARRHLARADPPARRLDRLVDRRDPQRRQPDHRRRPARDPPPVPPRRRHRPDAPPDDRLARTDDHARHRRLVRRRPRPPVRPHDRQQHPPQLRPLRRHPPRAAPHRRPHDQAHRRRPVHRRRHLRSDRPAPDLRGPRQRRPADPPRRPRRPRSRRQRLDPHHRPRRHPVDLRRPRRLRNLPRRRESTSPRQDAPARVLVGQRAAHRHVERSDDRTLSASPRQDAPARVLVGQRAAHRHVERSDDRTLSASPRQDALARVLVAVVRRIIEARRVVRLAHPTRG